MLKRTILIAIISVLPLLLFAQTQVKVLVAAQLSENKIEYIVPGLKLKVAYEGYRGQNEVTKGELVTVTDSTLTLKVRKFLKKSELRTIALRDITGFRKIGPLRELGVALVKLAVTVGGVVVVAILSANGVLTPVQAVLINTAVGFGGQFGLDRLFKNKIKNKTADGWRFSTVEI